MNEPISPAPKPAAEQPPGDYAPNPDLRIQDPDEAHAVASAGHWARSEAAANRADPDNPYFSFKTEEAEKKDGQAEVLEKWAQVLYRNPDIANSSWLGFEKLDFRTLAKSEFNMPRKREMIAKAKAELAEFKESAAQGLLDLNVPPDIDPILSYGGPGRDGAPGRVQAFSDAMSEIKAAEASYQALFADEQTTISQIKQGQINIREVNIRASEGLIEAEQADLDAMAAGQMPTRLVSSEERRVES